MGGRLLPMAAPTPAWGLAGIPPGLYDIGGVPAGLGQPQGASLTLSPFPGPMWAFQVAAGESFSCFWPPPIVEVVPKPRSGKTTAWPGVRSRQVQGPPCTRMEAQSLLHPGGPFGGLQAGHGPTRLTPLPS